MADKRIEDATPDTNVTGVEKLPVSDAGVAKCMTVSQVKDFTVSQIQQIAAASGITIGTDGVYLLKDGALKPVGSETLAAAVLDYGFGKVAVVSMNGNEIVGVKDATTQKTITVSQLKTWLEANMTIPTDIDIGSKSAAGALASDDLLLLAQSGTNKKLTLTTLAAYVNVVFKEYVASLTEVATLSDSDIFYVINGTTAKKCTVLQLKTLIGAGDVTGPSATTNNNIPQWDSTTKHLKDGLSVQGTVRASGTASSSAIPTEAAVRDALEGKVDKVSGMGLSKNDYSDAEKAKVAALQEASVAPWVASKTYAVGDYCLYGGFLRRCITAGSVATFNPAWWEYYPAYPTTDANAKYLRGDGTWSAPASENVFSGATASADGTKGLVPAPAIADKDKFLKGDGTWGEGGGSSSDMTGATSSTPGTHGLVPAPVAGDNEKFLRGDGTWSAPAATAQIRKYGVLTNNYYIGTDEGGVTDANISPDEMTSIELDGTVTTFTLTPSLTNVTEAGLYEFMLVYQNSSSQTFTVTTSATIVMLPTGVASLGAMFKAKDQSASVMMGMIRGTMLINVQEGTPTVSAISFKDEAEHAEV